MSIIIHWIYINSFITIILFILFNPFTLTFNHTIVAREPGDCFQMDIMVYNRFQYDNYKYILTCIDVYSRYAQAIPLKSKHLNVDQELWNTRELQQ
jgi:hypothetical protein